MLELFILQSAILLFIFCVFFLLGSLFNNIIDRTIRGEQFVKGKSYCESCKHELGFWDLVPVFSFLFLRGKCRYCKAKIPSKLIVLELVTFIGLSGVFIWVLKFSNFSTYFDLIWVGKLGFGEFLSFGSFLLFLIILGSILILIFFSDVRYKLIPDTFLWVLGILYLGFFVVNYFRWVNWLGYEDIFFFPFSSHLLSMLWILVVFVSIYLLSKRKGMGEGDVILAPILAIYLSLPYSIVYFMSAFIFGSVFGILLILLKGKNFKSQVAFGPFLILGFVFAIIWGSGIISWYTRILGM